MWLSRQGGGGGDDRFELDGINRPRRVLRRRRGRWARSRSRSRAAACRGCPRLWRSRALFSGEREEGLHGGFGAAGAELAYQSDYGVGGEGQLLACETGTAAAAIGVEDVAGDVTASGDCVVEGVDGEAGLHPVADLVADYPVRAQVLDGAAIERSLPSQAQCPVMSMTHNRLGASGLMTRRTRSSWAGGPASSSLLDRFLPTQDHQPLVAQSRDTVRSLAVWSPERISSVRNRYPNSGSSRWTSKIALASFTSARSRSVTCSVSFR